MSTAMAVSLGIEAALAHCPPRIGRPQCGPAGAQGDQEFVLVAQAEKALELTGKSGIDAVLDQGGRPHGGRLGTALPQCQHVLFQIRRQIALIELQTDVHRQPALGNRIGITVSINLLG